MNFFVRSMPSSSRQAGSESSAQDDGFGGPFSPSPPPQKCTSVRTRRLQAWAGLLCQSGLVRAQSANPFSVFSPRTFSLLLLPNPRSPLPARSICLSPVATTGRPPPPPSARCPGHLGSFSSGPSPAMSTQVRLAPSLPFLLCETELPNPKLSYLYSDLISLQAYAVYV
jgi:hypothetical protein